MMLACGMLVIGMAMSIATDGGQPAFAGSQSPSSSPEPDPCIPVSATPIELSNFGEVDPCAGPGGAPQLTPRATNTPAVVPTEEPPAPPPATATPSGGAGAGGVSPPNTGDGSFGGDSAPLVALIAGLLLAVSGGGLLAAGARRR
jgi:hypothetical protein